MNYFISLDVEAPVEIILNCIKSLICFHGKNPPSFFNGIIPYSFDYDYFPTVDTFNEFKCIIIRIPHGNYHLVTKRKDRFNRFQNRITIFNSISNYGKTANFHVRDIFLQNYFNNEW